MTKRSNPTDEVVAYFTGRIPAEWFTSAPDITVDQEEILVVGPLADPAAELPDAATASDAAKAEVRRARVLRYREETREARIDIARDAEHRFDRTVAWGVGIADDVLTFTLSGLSKVCALPQMKLGWIVANGPRHEEALERLDLIADT